MNKQSQWDYKTLLYNNIILLLYNNTIYYFTAVIIDGYMILKQCTLY